MDYNFNTVSGVYSAERFKNVMNFIREYNETKARLGESVPETEIFKNMRGFEANPMLAQSISEQIKGTFGGKIPNKESEAKFLADYKKYMKNIYDKQRQNVYDARKAHQEKKRFTSPSGVQYSAKQLREAGTKAKENARKSSIFRLLAILAGVALGGFLAPLLLTSVFTGVMATSTLFSITAIGEIAGMVAGGILGKKIYDANGRKEKLANNKMLAKFMAENEDILNSTENQLELEEERLNQLNIEFGLTENDITGEMECEVVNGFESSYAGFEAESSEDDIVEEEIHEPEAEEPEFEPVELTPSEPEGDEHITSEPSEPIIDSPEPEVVVPTEPLEPAIDEPSQPQEEFEAPTSTADKIIDNAPKFEPVEEDEEIVAPTFEFNDEDSSESINIGSKGETPIVWGDDESESSANIHGGFVFEPEETSPTADEVAPDEQLPEDEELTEEVVSKKAKALRALYSRAINQGTCSAVGQYILTAFREESQNYFDGCETVGELNAVYEGKKAGIKTIVNDYKKYKSKENGKDLPCLQELDESEQGRFSNETELPDYISVEVDGKTYFDAIKRGYVKTNKKLINGYLENIGAEQTLAKEIQETAKIEFIQEMADAKDFKEIAAKIKAMQKTMGAIQGKISDRVNAGGQLGADEEEMEM